MNRKHILAVLSSLPLVACLLACSSDNEESKAGAEMLSVEREVAFAATETSCSVKLTADCAWEVTDVIINAKKTTKLVTGMPQFKFNNYVSGGFDLSWGWEYVLKYFEAGLKS